MHRIVEIRKMEIRAMIQYVFLYEEGYKVFKYITVCITKSDDRFKTQS